MTFDSFYWHGARTGTLELEQARERLAASGDRAAFELLLRSGDPVAIGVALDQYDYADASTRHGPANPFDGYQDEVIARARAVLRGPPSPASFGAEPGANHASALSALSNVAEPEDSELILRALEQASTLNLRFAAARTAGTALERSPRCVTLEVSLEVPSGNVSRVNMIPTHHMKVWESYEEVAAYLLDQFAQEFGLERVEGKQQMAGLRSGTTWEIDAKGVLIGDTGFLLIECRRSTTSRQSQEKIGALAYRIIDTGAKGAILVSPLGLQEGAEKIAEVENIVSVLLDEKSTTQEYVMQFLNRMMIGVSDRVEIGESLEIVVRDRDGNIVQRMKT